MHKVIFIDKNLIIFLLDVQLGLKLRYFLLILCLPARSFFLNSLQIYDLCIAGCQLFFQVQILANLVNEFIIGEVQLVAKGWGCFLDEGGYFVLWSLVQMIIGFFYWSDWSVGANGHSLFHTWTGPFPAIGLFCFLFLESNLIGYFKCFEFFVRGCRRHRAWPIPYRRKCRFYFMLHYRFVIF